VIVSEVTARSVWPVSTGEAAEYLGLPGDWTSHTLELLVRQATEAVERATLRATTQRTLDVYLAPPFGPRIALPYPPVQSIDGLYAVDDDTGETQLDLNDWNQLGEEPRKLWPKNGVWPYCDRLRIRCVCGYASADDVPEQLKLDILRVVAAQWESRSQRIHVDARPLIDEDLCRQLERND